MRLTEAAQSPRDDGKLISGQQLPPDWPDTFGGNAREGADLCVETIQRLAEIPAIVECSAVRGMQRC